MELGRIHFFENVESLKAREFVQSHNHCVLCRSFLELRHMCGDEKKEIKEEAYCPQCDLRTRTKVYSVH